MSQTGEDILKKIRGREHLFTSAGLALILSMLGYPYKEEHIPKTLEERVKAYTEANETLRRIK